MARKGANRKQKRLSASRALFAMRKTSKWIISTKPGAHPKGNAVPLGFALRELLNYAGNAKEMKMLLNSGKVLVDGRRRKDPHFITGFMDTLSLSHIKVYYRMLLSSKGNLYVKPISAEEAEIKVCKIIGKSINHKKIQLNLYDSKNILVDEGSYHVGDSVVVQLPANTIKEALVLKKGAMVMLIGGKHRGRIGAVESITGTKLSYKRLSGTVFSTEKKYAFVIGSGKDNLALTIDKPLAP